MNDTATTLADVLKYTGASPTDAFRPAGTARLTSTREFTDYYQYAAYWVTITAEPQEVTLETNGYYVRFRVEGTVTGGGSNVGGKRNVTQHGDAHGVTTTPYAYEADRLEFLYGVEITLSEDFEPWPPRTGYRCKSCAKPSPVGIGYATSEPLEGDIDACPCGYSRKPQD